MKQKYVLIVAGGSGTRMGTEVPKQFLPIGGKPVLMRTIEAFCACFGRDIRTILVLPSSQQGYWDRLCREHRFSLPCDVADGGATRFHSVCNGLKLVRERAALVGVHDGVRPFVSASVIRQCYAVAERYGAAVPVVPVVESMRCLQGGGHSIAVNSEHYRLVQTPQVFDADKLREAYAQPFSPAFTDDASVAESIGIPIHLVDGNRENIKLTTPSDLKIAEALLDTPCSI